MIRSKCRPILMAFKNAAYSYECLSDAGALYGCVCDAASCRHCFFESFCHRAGRGASSGRRRQYRQRRANQHTVSASTLAEGRIAAAVGYEFIGRRPNDDVVVGDARPADGSRMAVERRFRLSNKSECRPEIHGERVMRSAMLICAFTSTILSHTAFLSQDAVAGSSEAGQTQTVQEQPRLRLAQNTGEAENTGAKVTEGAEPAANGEIARLSAAARA